MFGFFFLQYQNEKKKMGGVFYWKMFNSKKKGEEKTDNKNLGGERQKNFVDCFPNVVKFISFLILHSIRELQFQ